MKRLLLAAALAASSCGRDDPPAAFNISLPWTAATGHGAEISTDLARLGAVLEVSSLEHEPCQLSIGADLTTYGTCPGIPPAEVRSLAITYTVTPLTAVTAQPIAFHVGYVDLTPEAIGDDDSVSLTLVNDGLRGRIVRSEAEIASLPASSNQKLRTAEEWIKDLHASRDYNLDDDDDNCSNLDEACNDTLYDANNTSCAH